MGAHDKLQEISKHLSITSFRWLTSLQISQKITLGYGIVLGIAIIGTGTGILLSNSLRKEARETIEHTTEEITLPTELERHILFLRICQQELTISLDSENISQQKLAIFKYHLDRAKLTWSEFKNHYRQHSRVEGNSEELQMASEIVIQYNRDLNIYLDELEKINKSLQVKPLYSEQSKLIQKILFDLNDNEFDLKMQNFLIELDNFTEIVSRDRKTTTKVLEDVFQLQLKTIIISLSLSIIAGLFSALNISRSISHPLQTLKFSIDKASEIIFWVDAEGIIVYANQETCKYLGYEPDEILKMAIFDLDLDFPTASWAGFWAKLKSVGLVSFESSVQHKIGWNSQIELDINYLEVNDIAYGCAFCRDISERKDVENTLILAKKTSDAANKAKSEFLANMSHELRTPLNAILGFTRLMNRDSNLTAKQLENLETINRSGEHLLSLINDVLNLSKIESGQMTFNSTSFDLHHLLKTLEEMFKIRADDRGIKLILDCAANLPQYIRTDEQKLRQVLMNLLSNAIKFTKSGGVTLRMMATEEERDLIRINCEVEDTGYGIAPAELNNLFEPFLQTTSGKKTQEGTGLGLPISRKFAQLMGGDISVSSQVNYGTVVKFDFTVEIANPGEISSEINHPRVIGLKPGQPKYRILIVDDIWENRQILVQLLESVGFEVAEAENGQQAVLIWSTWKPNLIWMDMRMPVLDGYQATQQIRNHLEGQSTAIIALTASAFEEQKSVILASGCDDYVSKPFRESTIWEKISEYLGVNYIYEEKPEYAIAKTDPNFKLEASALQIMPSEWIAKLAKASLDLDEELIIELLAQIPDEYSLLTQALQNKFDNFDFETILNLARQANIS